MRIKKFNESNIGKKRVYIDMDGVLCDFYGAAAKSIVNNPNRKYPQSKIGFFVKLDPLEKAIESFNKLSEKYDVWILTRPSFRNTHSYTEKADWVLKNLGFKALEKTIFSGDKSLLKGDYLIDDQIGAGQDRFEGELIRFGSDKFKGWKEVMEYLM